MTDEMLKDFLRLLWIFENSGIYFYKPADRSSPYKPDIEYQFELYYKNKLPPRPVFTSSVGVPSSSVNFPLFFSFRPSSKDDILTEADQWFAYKQGFFRFMDYCWRQIKLDSNTLEDPLELSGSHMRKFVDRLWEIAH